MRILHTSLGWPPFRSGGLVRYCCDLMEAQVVAGDEVAVLYPAGYALSERAHITKGKHGEIISYALYSRNIVPLVFGTKNPDSLDCSVDSEAYRWLLDDFAPQVVHIHSFQGIGFSFFEQVNRRDIRCVFTTHDYYPICLKCNFINQAGEVCPGPSANRCAVCNLATGLTRSKNMLMQSALYRLLKNTGIVKKLRDRVKSKDSNKDSSLTQNHIIPKEIEDGFKNAIDVNHKIIEMMDIIHANSTLAGKIYSSAFPGSAIRVVPITHAGIDCCAVSHKNSEVFRIGYVGGANVYKGYKVLLRALFELPETIKWELLFFGTRPDTGVQFHDDRIQYLGFYQSNQVAEVLGDMDVLVVPSIWPETFGFVVVEALSVGTPVICSDMVGAAALLDSSMVFESGNDKELADLLANVYSNRPRNARTLFRDMSIITSMKKQAEAIKIELYNA